MKVDLTTLANAMVSVAGNIHLYKTEHPAKALLVDGYFGPAWNYVRQGDWIFANAAGEPVQLFVTDISKPSRSVTVIAVK